MTETFSDRTGREPAHPARRDFLYLTTGSVAAVGVAALAWPFIDQMNPDAHTIAAAGPIDIDVTQIQPGQRIVALWSARPVFIVRRTPESLKALQDAKLTSQLRDPDSENLQQPEYAKNWHRSLKEEFLVLVGICTHLGCVPLFDPEARSDELQRPIGRAAFSAPVTARNTILRAASSRAFRRPTISPCLPIFSRTRRLCAWREPPGQTFDFNSVLQV